MDSKKRVYEAMSGNIPDRVPYVPKIWVDLAAKLTNSSLYDIINNPKHALYIIAKAGIEQNVDAVRQFHFPKRKIEIDNDIVYELDEKNKKIGIIDMKGGLSTHLFNEEDYNLEDPYIMSHHHYWAASKPIIKSINDVNKIAIPTKDFLRDIGMEKRQKSIMDYVDNKICLIGDCSSATLAFYVCLRGMDNAMMDLYDNPSLVHKTMEKGVKIAIEKGKFNIDMNIKILRLNDSVANMSVISPNHWREFIKPYMKQVCDELHNYDKDVKIYCHICGNVLPVIEDIVETGIDCIGPLDPMGGFTCKQARERVGNDVALMGGVNTLSFIHSSEKEIVEEAKKCIIDAGEKGGFLLGSGCVIPRSAKKENIKVLAKVTKEYGVYKEDKLIKVRSK